MDAKELTVRIYGDPCLREKCAPVEHVGPAERMLVESMLKTMYAHQGVGLAAPQVGVSEQIFVTDSGEGPMAFINPKITKKEGAQVMEEGCLSIPGVQVNVKRARHITVKYIDENGRARERLFSDLPARVILHETDHLHGKLIVDYAGLAARVKLKKPLRELEELSRRVHAG